MMIKYAVIGRGKIVDSYIKGASMTGCFELVAVYSRAEDTGREYARKNGCKKVYTDLQELAADEEIEAVYIASPNSCHAWQSEALLKGGKHVICEKPITTSAKEYMRIKKLADSLGLIYMEAIIPRYVGGRQAIKDAIGKIGRIAMARIDYCQLSSRYDAFMRGQQVNIFDMLLSAGTLNDLGIYCVYAAVDLFGVPKNIKTSASLLYNGADGSGCAVFEYDTFLASLIYSKVGQSISPSEIIGDKGSVVIEKIGLYMGVYLIQGENRIPLFVDEKKETLMCQEATAFADFIKGKRTEEYAEVSRLCLDVHTCMDTMRRNSDE